MADLQATRSEVIVVVQNDPAYSHAVFFFQVKKQIFKEI
jgi:hypothetical protein